MVYLPVIACLIFISIMRATTGVIKTTFWCYREKTIKTKSNLNNKHKLARINDGLKKILYPAADALYYDLHCVRLLNTMFGSLVEYKPDIIHAHDFVTVPTALAVAKMTGAKVVYDAHELELDRRPGVSRLEKLLLTGLLKKHLPMIDGIVSTHDKALQYYHPFIRAGIPQCALANAPLVEKTSDVAKFNLKQKCGIPEDSYLVVFTGSIGLNRGVPEVVEALGRLKNAHLAIMGSQQPQSIESINEIARTFNMNGRVHFLDAVPHWQVASTIGTADVGVCLTKGTHLNHVYAMPNKLFEMSLAGLPLVVSNLPMMGEYVKTEKIGVIVNPNYVASIEQGFLEILTHLDNYRPDPERLANLRQRWAWSAQAEKLLKFYEELIRMPR